MDKGIGIGIKVKIEKDNLQIYDHLNVMINMFNLELDKHFAELGLKEDIVLDL